MTDKTHVELVITAKELIDTFYEVGFGVNGCCRVQLTILVCVCLQSLLKIIVDRVGIVEVELGFRLIDIFTSGSIKESA